MSASTLGCIGLGVDDVDALDGLLDRALAESSVVGRPGAVVTRRWSDAVSGAQLTVLLKHEQVLDLVPSYQAQHPVDLAMVGELDPESRCSIADVMENGTLVTKIACHVPQSPYFPRGTIDVVSGAVTLLGLDVEVFADADAFAVSDASLLDPGTADGPADSDDPDPDDADGPTGPVRWGAESLLPLGAFGTEGHEPVAQLAGVVEASETRTNALTGQAFHIAVLRTVGMKAALCLAADDHAACPQPGNVVAGLCYVVVDLPTLWKDQPKPKRSWLRRH